MTQKRNFLLTIAAAVMLSGCGTNLERDYLTISESENSDKFACAEFQHEINMLRVHEYEVLKAKDPEAADLMKAFAKGLLVLPVLFSSNVSRMNPAELQIELDRTRRSLKEKDAEFAERGCERLPGLLKDAAKPKYYAPR